MDRSAVMLLQAMANMQGAKLKVDGIFGPATLKAVNLLDTSARASVDAALKNLGAPSIEEYTEGQTPRSGNRASGREFPEVWYELVDSAKKLLPSFGINPAFAIAQFAIESDWGRKPSGKFNFGGIKANSVGHKSGTTTMTSEEYDGKRVRESALWADFDSVDAFVKSYGHYLTKGPSAYRYRGLTNAASAREFFTILKNGGYATDSSYVALGQDVFNSVRRRNLA